MEPLQQEGRPLMRRIDINPISWRDVIVVGLPLAVVVVVAFWLASRSIQPAPPDRLVRSTGAPGGDYQRYGERYRELLAREGVTLELRASNGSVENAERPVRGQVDAAFVQSGTMARRASTRSRRRSTRRRSRAPPRIRYTRCARRSTSCASASAIRARRRCLRCVGRPLDNPGDARCSDAFGESPRARRQRRERHRAHRRFVRRCRGTIIVRRVAGSRARG